MENSLFNETTIKRLVSGIKITAKQKKAVKVWLDHLENKKLENEKQAYIEFARIILKDLLDYDISLDGLKHEEGNMEFPFRDSSGNYLVVFEAKGTKTKRKTEGCFPARSGRRRNLARGPAGKPT